MKPIDWSRVDPEMVEVVKAINNLPHVKTIDSFAKVSRGCCFCKCEGDKLA